MRTASAAASQDRHGPVGGREAILMMMTKAAALATLILMLGACGGRDDGAAPPAAAAGSPRSAVAADGAGARATAAEALDCPADVRERPGPDIAGLRFGMGLDEAMHAARCLAGPGAAVAADTSFVRDLDTQGVPLGTQFFTVGVDDGTACNRWRNPDGCDGPEPTGEPRVSVAIAIPGMPGEEKALAIWRTQEFPEGKQPSVQSLRDALLAKYGPAQGVEQYDDSSFVILKWMRDASGAPISEQNPLYSRCLGGVSGKASQASAQWGDGCGVNIRAEIWRSEANNGLARELDVSMIDQAGMFAQIEAMKAALRRAGAARRADELRAAEKQDVSL